MTLDKLIQAQNIHFPGSKILSREDVKTAWLTTDSGTPGVRHYTDAAPSIALTLLQHDPVLFYEWEGYRGARYGVKASQYVSGFGTGGKL